ncbi:MAG: methyltransferase domain-containing protein [Planctomycetia bacterium]|nr:methyltransferase domain-containing protein [Planctomycetia bacterium]
MVDSNNTVGDFVPPDDSSVGLAPIEPAKISHNLLFLQKFFRHGTRIAAVWPSSRFMARASIQHARFSSARCIVELGAGTGPITTEIVKRLNSRTKFFALERDNDFFSVLQKRFVQGPNVRIIQGDVGHLETILQDHGIEPRGVDCFVSGLGTPSLPEAVRRGMFAAVRKYLHPDGFFSNITEVPWYYLNFYKSIFKNVSFQFVGLNMPPGGVYHCRNILPNAQN